MQHGIVRVNTEKYVNALIKLLIFHVHNIDKGNRKENTVIPW